MIPAELARELQPYTKSTPLRMASMYDAIETVDKEKIPGDVVECGVWRGGNILMARMMSPSRLCWLYDTFEGMPEPHHTLDVKRPREDGRDAEKAIDRWRLKKSFGTLWDAISLEEAQRPFRDMGLFENTQWIVGEIELTLFSQSIPERIAILRLDMDWYNPTKAALEALYPRLTTGGFLIVDDYGHWMGCKKAVDDFFGGRPEQMEFIDYSCVVMRKC